MGDRPSRGPTEAATWIAVAAAIAAVVGSVGPWVEATFATTDGLDGDGWMTLAFGAAALALLLLTRGEAHRDAALALLALGVATAAVAIFHIIDLARTDFGVLEDSVAPGWGAVLTAVAGLILAGGALVLGAWPAPFASARWRTALGTVVVLVIGGVAIGVAADEDSLAPAAPERLQALPPEPAPAPAPASEQEEKVTVKRFGQGGEDDRISFRVDAVERVSSIPVDIGDPIRASAGARLHRVDLTYKNNRGTPIALYCDDFIGVIVQDAGGRLFTPMSDSRYIKGFEPCGDPVQPGLKASASMAFSLPAGARPARVVVWNPKAAGDAQGTASRLEFVLRRPTA